MYNIHMETIARKQTAFRLRDDLIQRLKIKAAKENRSLNNYVENILMDVAYHEPNEETQEAINESKNGIFAGDVDTSSYESFKESLGL